MLCICSTDTCILQCSVETGKKKFSHHILLTQLFIHSISLKTSQENETTKSQVDKSCLPSK